MVDSREEISLTTEPDSRFDPDIAGERKRIIAAAKLDGSGRRSASDGFEMNFDESAAVDDFFADRLEGVAGFEILVQDEEHAGEAVGDEQGFGGIAEGFLASFADFRQA